MSLESDTSQILLQERAELRHDIAQLQLKLAGLADPLQQLAVEKAIAAKEQRIKAIEGELDDWMATSGQGQSTPIRTQQSVALSAAQFSQSLAAGDYLRLLAVIAAPVANAEENGPPAAVTLDVWGEWERLRQATVDRHVGSGSAPWALIRLAPPTGEALDGALTAARYGRPYHVLHVCSHGGPDGVTLEDAVGRESQLGTDRLVEMLRGSGVQIVVLNACDTEEVATRLVTEAGIQAAIATSDAILDAEGKLFAREFYRRLAVGETVAEALAAAQGVLIAAYHRGDLFYYGAGANMGQERAGVFKLFGAGDLRLRLDGPPAAAPISILQPTPQSANLIASMLDGFTGRHVELLQMARWLDETGRRAFAISGVGGVGKTALALNAAWRHAHHFQALVFASAKDNPNFGLIETLNALNAVLGLATTPSEAEDLAGAVAARLNSRAVLLLLDNLESVSPARAADLARALRGLDPRHGSRVLMTLRPRDRDPLTALVDGRDRLELHALDPASALRLVWEEAERQGIELEKLDGEPPTAAEQKRLNDLCYQAGLGWMMRHPRLEAGLEELARLAFHHPALVKLAAAMLRTYDRPGVLARLRSLQGQDIGEALTEFIGAMIDDLAAAHPPAIDVLYAALPFRGSAAPERLYWVALGHPIDDQGAVIAFEDSSVRPALDAMLLQRPGNRLELEPPVRGYLEKVRPPDSQLLYEMQLRHAAAHAEVVAGYNAAIADGRMTYAAPSEWENVTAAWDWLSTRVEHDDEAAQVLLAHADNWRNVVMNNYDPRREGWLEAATKAALRIGTPSQQADFLQAKGDVLAFLDRRDEALTHYDNAFRLYQQVGSSLGQANVLQAKGDVLAFQKRNDEALTHYDNAFRLFQQVGSSLGQANALLALGDLSRQQKAYDRAWQSYEQTLGLYEMIGDGYSLARVLYRMGDWHAEQQHKSEAADLYRRAIALWQAIGMDDLASSIILPRLQRVTG